jgi:hypothetical protein
VAALLLVVEPQRRRVPTAAAKGAGQQGEGEMFLLLKDALLLTWQQG